MRKARPSLEIPDDAPLTQYGELLPARKPMFRNRLREGIGETEISLIWGRLEPAEAAKIVTHVVNPLAATRYTTAGELREHGFVVRHSPIRSNPKHVSVIPAADHPEPAVWDDAMAQTFDRCFTDPVGGETA